MNLEQANAAARSLVIFRNLPQDPVIRRFFRLIQSDGVPQPERISLYADFVAELYQTTNNLSGYFLECVLTDENPYVIQRGMGRTPPAYLEERILEELHILEEISRISSEEVQKAVGYSFAGAGWETSPLDFVREYRNQLERIHENGYGIFARTNMFVLRDGQVTPIRHPDPVRLADLTGYEAERGRVIRNTLALLDGRPAANVLLYGDSGTGKSTCVKAVANEYRDRGLRLIELRKDQLFQIPELISRLSKNPLKFILFIDDLSFSGQDGNFSALKAMLEGSVSAKTQNIVIYATSNRRHLIKESFSDREGDDVHLNDTLEEFGSLSDRFGLVVTFLRPNQELYLDIVRSYLQAYQISLSGGDLRKQAEAFALSRGGRSPRIARQFAESLASQDGYGG